MSTTAGPPAAQRRRRSEPLRAAPGAAPRTPAWVRLEPSVLTAVAGATAVVLVLTGTGHLVTVAILLGLATCDRRVGAVGVLVALATSARFGTANLDGIAGVQAVLGAAGLVGPAAGAAASWAAAVALVLAARWPALSGGTQGRWRFFPAVACGTTAAAVVAAPTPLILAASVLAASALAAVVTLGDRHPGLVQVRLTAALVLAAAAAVLAGLAS